MADEIAQSDLPKPAPCKRERSEEGKLAWSAPSWRVIHTGEAEAGTSFAIDGFGSNS